MGTVRVLQLGTEDFNETMQVSDCADWHYEPDFSELPESDFDVVILDREVTVDEYEFLVRFVRAYCLFVTETVSVEKEGVTRQLFLRKMGKVLSEEELKLFLAEDLPCYFSGSYGEKFNPQQISVSQGFSGKVSWKGLESVDLEGNYGSELKQIAFWRYNIPIGSGQAIDFWLEYSKDDTVEIALEITLFCFRYDTIPELQEVYVFSEDEMENMICLENKSEYRRFAFISLKAMGRGHLSVIGLHDRHSRKGKGHFVPGGERAVTSKREEVFYYFDPGNLKPPLNVYFSGYKTKEGFEGYYMMRNMEHPFLLISEPRLEGGSFYIGSEEYEDTIEQVIRHYMSMLGFQNSEVILSGLSMGSFGALYYGCRIHPNTILLGKPLASLGDVANNERFKRPDGSHSWLDVLHKASGSLTQEAVERLNDKFWNTFDQTDWSGTRFAVAYMIEDELDGNAYGNLQSHLRESGARIYGKGLHGRHNDNSAGIVNWFVNQYRTIIARDFDGIESKAGGQGK